jgi:hypothetical protein
MGRPAPLLALASDDTPLTDLALSYINALDPLDGLLLTFKKKDNR